MNDRTMTATYDTRTAAWKAHDELLSAGIPTDAISILRVEADGTPTATTAAVARADRGFWGGLSDLLAPPTDCRAREEELRRRGFVLSVCTTRALVDEAEAILDQATPTAGRA